MFSSVLMIQQKLSFSKTATTSSSLREPELESSKEISGKQCFFFSKFLTDNI